MQNPDAVLPSSFFSQRCHLPRWAGHDIRYNLITISHRILNFVSDNALHRFVEFVRLGVLIVTAG